MGLDMYMYGEKYLFRARNKSQEDQMEDGFRVSKKQLDIGYWRKHSNFHNFMVENFADGDDNCQPICLSVDDLKQIIDAVDKGILMSQKMSSIDFLHVDDELNQLLIVTIQKAIDWLSDSNRTESRSVYYQASW